MNGSKVTLIQVFDTHRKGVYAVAMNRRVTRDGEESHRYHVYHVDNYRLQQLSRLLCRWVSDCRITIKPWMSGGLGYHAMRREI